MLNESSRLRKSKIMKTMTIMKTMRLMKIVEKTICLLLIISLSAALFAACGTTGGGSGATTAATTAAPAETTAGTTAEAVSTTAAAVTTAAAASTAATAAATTYAAVITTSAMPAEQLATPDAEAELIEVTWFRSQINRNAITYWKDALWLQELQNRMNIKIDFNGPLAGHGSADYNSAVNVMINSGNLSDMIYYTWANNYSGGLAGAIEDGIIVNVSANPDYWSHMPHWQAIMASNDYIRKAVTLDDGSCVCFNQVEETTNRTCYNNTGIREDWLTMVGKDIPTTIDELYECFVAFKEAMPDVYPLTDTSGFGTIGAIAPAWGIKRNTMYPDPDTGKITYWTQYKDGEAFTDFVTTLNKWYAEGLIDPDFVTNDDAAKNAMMTNQKSCFALMMPQQFASYKEAIIAANPELDGIVHFYGLVPLIGPAGKTYNINSMRSWAASGSGTVVTTAAEKAGKVERILDMIDYLYSPEGTELNHWGVEGISYYIDDNGVKQWTELVTDDPDFNFGDAVFKYAIPTFGDWPKIMSYEAWLSQETKDPDARRAHENLLLGDPGLSMPSVQLTAEESEEYNRIRSDANTLIDEYFAQLIVGIRPLSDIPVLLGELDKLGLPRAVEIYQGAYDRFESK